ncbi:glycoside hydrolase family 2 [Paenibacillus sp. FSL H8-0548]|uniref:sugar-binding domain-containing protein n=1 Tax=Paenibacillus sp. FSL H8-0548 TaxID=1920422 RepID=UPI00096E63E1|nr:sugar-binding domain-containing protein [Paenibacillus sp. FSL H8-0548]OMF30770.1 glycoside hydrolase family 2 [Paenibacillus sp. FSL H8-0548]
MIIESIAGTWRFGLDAAKQGIENQYYKGLMQDEIQLPGTTAENKKGEYNTAREVAHLTETYPLTGYAWYQRDIEIKEEWAGKPIRLYLERTRVTQVWIGEEWKGMQDSVSAPHVYEFGSMAPGTYTLTVLVDNSGLPIKGGHMTSPDTQTNWNGLLGRIEIQVVELIRLERIHAFPDVANKSVRFAFQVLNDTSSSANVSISFEMADAAGTAYSASSFTERTLHISSEPGCHTVEWDYEIGEGAALWDEFTPVIYRMQLRLEAAAGQVIYRGEQSVSFGMRQFGTEGTQFTNNGRKVFLRGKHDALAFPLTGYSPMTVEEWVKVLSVAKSYGINHYRFHTCCPPEAGFAAADMLGVYFEPELPYWGTFHDPEDEEYDEAKADYLRKEGLRILEAYGNHPSFALFTLGNELHGSRKAMLALLKEYRERDSRRLYAEGANNYFWAPSFSEESDFWVTMRTGHGGSMVRASFSHADLPLGHVQASYPSTLTDYRDNLPDIQAPIVSHEIGQFQSFPNFGEIEKYVGVLQARNFEVFRERLQNAGMGDQADDFFRASGQLAVRCYREEIEAALRTPGFGGFQLLDLQDFPGQGTALVGVLDAFMDSKGFIEPEQWREFCSDIVLLARFPRYTYTEDETFEADLEMANYGANELADVQLEWSLKQGEQLIENGVTVATDVGQGALASMGKLQIKLSKVKAPAKLALELKWVGSKVVNHYAIWVYPSEVDTDSNHGVHVRRRLDQEVRDLLEDGGRVLLIADQEQLSSHIDGAFASDFWCYPMFRSICEGNHAAPAPGTLGILCDEQHPAFKAFPTEFHSNWQWWAILMNSHSLLLDDWPAAFRPIVQVIDNFERNHKLGLIVEAKVGSGSLLVCASDLIGQQDKPEARQLLHSLLRYAASAEFMPTEELSFEQIRSVLDPNAAADRQSHRGQAVVNPSYPK